MKHLLKLVISITFLSCVGKTKRKLAIKLEKDFTETGLKVTCTRTIKTLDNEIHGTYYTNNLGMEITKDSINNLLFSFSQLDDFEEGNCRKYSIGTFESWDKTNKVEKCFRLEKTEFIDNPHKTTIALTDFDLYLNGQIKKISLRFLNDYEVIKIVIGDNKIYKRSERIPLALETVIQKMDSLKLQQNASR